jgi:plasmid stabilization system protein ParE
MMRQIDFRGLARLDVEETANRLEQSDPRLAFRFRKAVRAAPELAAFFPKLGRLLVRKRSRLHGARYLILKGFRNHVLYFQPTKKGIIVLRVLRGSRDLDQIE